VKKITIEKDLNQETNLTCARPTRWSSYLPTLNSMIILFSATLDVLEEIKKKKRSKILQIAEAHGLQQAMRRFEFIFLLHLMRKLLLITNMIYHKPCKKSSRYSKCYAFGEKH
jgi:hypothetical protein